MIQAYKVIIEHDAGEGYVATFPEFAGCKAQAGSLKALIVCIGETMSLYAEEIRPAVPSDPDPRHRMAQVM